MEVAGQWRREWAGTAEYGKVTEGGITRQVARAMEVLHASAPGARVRVLRAAYHSTAGPGAPASSYLLHSSRRVISSGYNFIEAEPTSSRPLEISSTPLESSPEVEVGKENYKVTEPDDFDISEPSKWRGSKNINSIRMPSEESSSTDNASIIDLEHNNRNTHKKDTDIFALPTHHKRLSPISSFLDTPATLSTLKYKSLLNGNDNWNNRRKSYSFEETPVTHESILRETDAFTMDSSTDSGICKSSEIVNSENNNLESTRYVERKSKMDDIHEETFKDWLSKNRKKTYLNQVHSNKEHVVNIERNDQNNITLQSAGKVSITLPISTTTEDYCEAKNDRASDDYDKRTKKVEFCKTELHFAAETGTVNIIATDDKPPPSNDFRKKRSMFVPINTNYNKSITLFGDKSDVFEVNKRDNSGSINEINIYEENTAATKSILKNKIPKPKPYLLGENMVFGSLTEVKGDEDNNYIKPTGVSLINRQLQLERKFSNESTSSIGKETDWGSFKKITTRTTKMSPVDHTNPNQETEQTIEKKMHKEIDGSDKVNIKLKILQASPTPSRARTRQLRESDLTYFGVTKTKEKQTEKRKNSLDSLYDQNSLREETLNSVQLVKLISNSVCNSEADSDETPDYENVPMKYNFTTNNTRCSRSKHRSYLDGNKEQNDLNPILEKDDEIIIVEPRRVKVKRPTATTTSRSLSEPPKANRQKSADISRREFNKTDQRQYSPSSKSNTDTFEKTKKGKISVEKVSEKRKSVSPLYVNVGMKETKQIVIDENLHGQNKQSMERQKMGKKCVKNDSKHIKHTKNKSGGNEGNTIKERIDCRKPEAKQQHSERQNTSIHRTKVLVTPEKSLDKCRESSLRKHRNEETKSIRDKKVANSSAHKHYPTKTDPKKTVKDSHSGRESKEIKGLIQKNGLQISTDTTSTRISAKEQEENLDNTVAHIVMPHSKVNKGEKTDKAVDKSRRSKYVINYDDKNGTVSSICKIRPDHGSTKKKINVNYDNRDYFKNNSVNKNNSTNKNNLLQFPDQQRILYGKSKMKSKIRAQQSCQIL